MQLQLDLSHAPPSCALDSLDQGATGLVCDHVAFADRLGEHVAQRLAGGIVMPLASPAK